MRLAAALSARARCPQHRIIHKLKRGPYHRPYDPGNRLPGSVCSGCSTASCKRGLPCQPRGHHISRGHVRCAAAGRAATTRVVCRRLPPCLPPSHWQSQVDRIFCSQPSSPFSGSRTTAGSPTAVPGYHCAHGPDHAQLSTAGHPVGPQPGSGHGSSGHGCHRAATSRPTGPHRQQQPWPRPRTPGRCGPSRQPPVR